MSRSRRLPRRQGVVYGPVDNRDGFDAGSLVGRVLGMLVVVGAVGMLAVAAITFLDGNGQQGGIGASPTATAIADRTPTATPAAGAATPLATPAATAAATAVPTPIPTTSPPPAETMSPEPTSATPPTGPQVREGPGFVTFGTREGSGLRIVDPGTSFALNERITWSAQMIEPANSADMRIVTSKVDPQTGEERVVLTEEVRPRVTGARTFLRRLRPDRQLDGPGLYVVRYLRGETVMSEGSFEVRP